MEKTNPRKIIHFDLDAFFCAVEELQDPGLRTLPFAVGGRPDSRGVVASCSYAARTYGVHSAMPMAQALRHCPHLRIVAPRHGLYRQISRQVMALLHGTSRTVEQLSIDEAFLDVSGSPEPAPHLARRLQEAVASRLGLPSSLGVATNKLVAKTATDVGKAGAASGAYPNSVQVVPPGSEAEFLAPLPVEALWGVGPRTAEKLSALGLLTIGDIATYPAQEMERRFGKIGWDLHRRAQGIDERPVVPERDAKSVSQETTFAVDVRDGETLRRVVQEQADGVGRRLLKAGVAASTVKIKLRWPDFTTLTRQVTLEQPVQRGEEIAREALTLLEAHRPATQAVRLIGVGVSGLGPPVRQMSLFDLPASAVEREKADRLNDAVIALRKRFGDDALRRASEL